MPSQDMISSSRPYLPPKVGEKGLGLSISI